MRVIIGGGGTGGHVFPAISIADAIKRLNPNAEILFVGAKGRMEMERVPQAGYNIVGLPVAGFQRRLTFKNFTFFFKLIASILLARKIIKQFKPDVVVGVGGYASGPILRVAVAKKIPVIIQEQNSFPGVTNRLLAKKATKICVAYPDMERFFPAEKIVFTGNPIRKTLSDKVSKEEAFKEFGLNPSQKVILSIGGSLGAGSINKGIMSQIDKLKNSNIQMIWQTGKNYYEDICKNEDVLKLPNLKIMPFIQRMDLAYSIADVVISRAGAISVSELSLLGKAAILVPSPNVAEDHQTKNAMSLTGKNAAILIKDNETCEKLLPQAFGLLNDENKINELQKNILEFAKPKADEDIAEEVIKNYELRCFVPHNDAITN